MRNVTYWAKFPESKKVKILFINNERGKDVKGLSFMS